MTNPVQQAIDALEGFKSYGFNLHVGGRALQALREHQENNGWINVEDRMPETKASSYMCEMSEKILVKGEGRNQYPWVAHLHVDKANKYKAYAWGFDRDGDRYTWLNPYRDIADNQQVTHWKPLPQAPTGEE